MTDQLLSQPGDSLDVGPAWSGFPVGFALLTTTEHQYVAYYDENREMTVAQRKRDAPDWTHTRLPETLVWDSHNGISLAEDSAGHLHLSGNMHGDPLVYFRSREPHNASTLERIISMTGDFETNVTYPIFFEGAGGQLCFGYRQGGSGKGDQVYNAYDPTTQTWRRLTTGTMVSGGGERNAYLVGPLRGPDGWFHLCWVWRDSPDCASNHDLSYARSRDLATWETSAGAPLELPITIATAEVVDPVPTHHGLMNGNTKIGFDAARRVLISYHKLDTSLNTQIFVARREEAGWRTVPVTAWQGAWLPEGWGTVPFMIGVSAPRVDSTGQLTLSYTHAQHGSATLILDPDTLQPIGRKSGSTALTSRWLSTAEPRLHPCWAPDSAPSAPYVLRWESLEENRDKAVEGPLPAPAMLRVVRLDADDREALAIR